MDSFAFGSFVLRLNLNYTNSICNDSKYVKGLEDIIMKNINVNFAWIDWQQGQYRGGCVRNFLHLLTYVYSF